MVSESAVALTVEPEPPLTEAPTDCGLVAPAATLNVKVKVSVEFTGTTTPLLLVQLEAPQVHPVAGPVKPVGVSPEVFVNATVTWPYVLPADVVTVAVTVLLVSPCEKVPAGLPLSAS